MKKVIKIKYILGEVLISCTWYDSKKNFREGFLFRDLLQLKLIVNPDIIF